jgi:hypothetical protein
MAQKGRYDDDSDDRDDTSPTDHALEKNPQSALFDRCGDVPLPEFTEAERVQFCE